MARPGALLSALRPRQWLHFAVLPAACFELATPLASALALARGIAITICVLGYGYLLNAISDRGLDLDRRKNPLAGQEAIGAAPLALVAILAALALGLGATSSKLVIVATSVALVSGALYSVGPRLKARPVICTLMNASCFAPLLLVGAPGASVGPDRWLLVAIFIAMLLQNQLLHEAADAPEDRGGGLVTTFVAFGPVPTAWLALVAGAAALGLVAWLVPTLFLAVVALPFASYFPWRLAKDGAVPARMARVRRLHRLASAITGALLFGVVLAR